MKVARRESAEVMVETSNNADTLGIETQEQAPELPAIPQNSAQKNGGQLFTIRLNRKHSCFIGGTYYVFDKNQVYRVPSDVKRVLSVAGLLAPL